MRKKKQLKSKANSFKYSWKNQKILFLMMVPVVAYYALFHYLPFYGLQIAFKRFSPFVGIWESKWVGFDNFKYLFFGPGALMFLRALKNTFIINFYELIFAFPLPILLAVLFNEMRSASYRKVAQTALYLPHFISQLVIAGMVINFLSPTTGVVNNILVSSGILAEPIYFMIKPEYYRFIYIASGVWKDVGFDSIIYFAALLGISPSLYEAARVDGANRFQQMWNVTLPGISSTVIIMFILKVGKLLKIGFEKTILLYTPSTYKVSDVLGSYVFRIGLQGSNQLDMATAAGLFEAIVGLTLVVIANKMARKYSDTSLF